MGMILCDYCRAQKPDLPIGENTLLRVAEVLANGSKGRAIGEIQAETSCDDLTAKKWIDHFEACCWSWPVSAGDIQVLNLIDAAFMHIQKPEHFTDYTHCDECSEHDNTLRGRTRETLRRKDLGNPGWDPLCFTTEEGIGYLFPALARFSFMPDGHAQYGCYIDQLIWHLSYEGGNNRFFRWCNAQQRAAVFALLKHLSLTRNELVIATMSEDKLTIAMSTWNTSQNET